MLSHANVQYICTLLHVLTVHIQSIICIDMYIYAVLNLLNLIRSCIIIYELFCLFSCMYLFAFITCSLLIETMFYQTLQSCMHYLPAGALSDGLLLPPRHRDELEDMLRAITMERARIRETMIWCLDHAESADEVRGSCRYLETGDTHHSQPCI